jgi:AbrB family transcriptional regulator (stage V sporulation protein T)
MKATGIIRRIDDLGRVVIPKELRRMMHLSEGDPLEIYTADQGQIILKKHSAILGLDEVAYNSVATLSKSVGCPVLLADTECIVSSRGIKNSGIVKQNLSSGVRALIKDKKRYVKGNDDTLSATEETDIPVFAVIPIVSAFDTWGAVILLNPEKGRELGELEISLAQLVADILADQLKS